MNEPFSALIPMLLFSVFFLVGYLSEKRSAGAFLIVAGFTLITLILPFLTAFGILGILLIATGVFIILIGINKWLITPNLKE